MNKRSLTIITALAALLLLGACQRRPLEVYYKNVVNIQFNYDWEQCFGFTPKAEDIAILLYNDREELIGNVRPSDPRYYTVRLEEGRYFMMTYTPEDDWTGSARFEDLGNFSMANCRAEDITTRNFRQWDQGTRYMADPYNPIGVVVDTFEITHDMVSNELTFVDYRDRDVVPDTADIVMHEVPEPMTTVLNVRVLLKGYRSMRSLEANISGMADGFWMNRVDRTNETGILLLDGWEATPYKDADPAWNARAQEQSEDSLLADEWGWVTTSIITFGLPLGKETAAARDSTDNVLRMAFLLRDGSVQQFTFNVGKKLRYETPSGDALSKAEVLKHINVEILLDYPPDAPDLPDLPDDNASASGFDAYVDEWDDGGTMEIGGF